jgi:hypothetical protein
MAVHDLVSMLRPPRASSHARAFRAVITGRVPVADLVVELAAHVTHLSRICHTAKDGGAPAGIVRRQHSPVVTIALTAEIACYRRYQIWVVA